MRARIVLHLPVQAHDLAQAKPFVALYPRIAAVMRARGAEVVVAGRSAAMMAGGRMPGDGDLHVVENGWVSGPGWLNAAIAYLPGFWHVDPVGILADSRIGAMAYDPASVDPAAAQAFRERLRQAFVLPRRSRYRQPPAREAIPEGAIAVFLQGPQPYRRGQAHVPADDMLRAVVAGAAGRPVVVKPHPQTEEFCAEAIAAVAAEGARFQVVRANVHDILARAAVTVSVNSAVAVEGFLHDRPAILFGRADFGRFAETVTDPQGFPAALDRALSSPRDYAVPLLWYFSQCLDLDAPDLAERLLALFAAEGFDARRLGLG